MTKNMGGVFCLLSLNKLLFPWLFCTTIYIFTCLGFAVAGCHLSLQQIPVAVLTPRNMLSMQQGLGWPHQLNVVEGHDALLRVQGRLETAESCVISTPTGLQFDIRSPPSTRFEAWSDGCGVRVHNVLESDEGRWRITATAGNNSLVGWSILIVDKDTTTYSAPDIELLDGTTHTEIELTTLNNSYCVVAQPFSESSLVPGHCRVTLDRATRAVQGNWNVLLGLPGKVQELQIQRRVAVEAERLDMGYIRDTATNKLHLYCDILNTQKNITFCRFQKTSSSIGYNVVDGLSDGVHSYYGDGFLLKHCGMTIERPTAEDYGTWRCSVGVQQFVDNVIQQQTPLQALISVGPESSRVRELIHRAEDDDLPTVFVQEQQSFAVSCRADESLSYCWFQHPNGTAFTPGPLQTEDQLFWYTGENLQMGDCGITFSHATPEENGLWTCHMGPRETMGIEITDRVEVRVTGPLAANKKEILTYIDDTVNLHCHTSNGNKPLDYCRFLSPQAVGFRIDNTVTEENAIMGRYFFMPGKSLDYGDCALTISGVQHDDLGQWTCAALINNDGVEAWDTADVTIGSAGPRAPLSRAGIVGMAVGASVLIITLVGVALYKTGLVRIPLWRNRRTESERFALGSLSTAARGSTTNSENSACSSEITVSELGEVIANNKNTSRTR